MLCFKIVGIYKKHGLTFQFIQDSFCLSVYKMVDSEYSMEIYKSVKISIGAVTKNPGLLKFVPDHL